MALDLTMISWIRHKKLGQQQQKIDTLDCIKIFKKFCTPKDAIKSVKRQGHLGGAVG